MIKIKYIFLILFNGSFSMMYPIDPLLYVESDYFTILPSVQPTISHKKSQVPPNSNRPSGIFESLYNLKDLFFDKLFASPNDLFPEKENFGESTYKCINGKCIRQNVKEYNEISPQSSNKNLKKLSKLQIQFVNPTPTVNYITPEAMTQIRIDKNKQ